MLNHSITRYGQVAQAFHWATALFVLVTFLYGLGGSEKQVYSVASDFDRQIHETLGLSVFALVFAGGISRACGTPSSPAPQERCARLNAAALGPLVTTRRAVKYWVVPLVSCTST